MSYKATLYPHVFAQSGPEAYALVASVASVASVAGVASVASGPGAGDARGQPHSSEGDG